MHTCSIERLEERKLLAFTIGVGGSGFDYGNSVARLSDGGVVVAGVFSGTVSFGQIGGSNATLTSAGDSDAFAARYDIDGNLVWARQFGGPFGRFRIEDNLSRAVDVAVNPIRVGGEVFTQGVTPVPWGAGEYATGVAVDPADRIYLTGAFTGRADFDPGPGQRILETFDADYYDIFVLKLTPAGNLIWAEQFGGRFTDVPSGIALDSDGNPHITGVFTRDVNFHPRSTDHILTALGRADTFVMKLSVNGKLIWVRQFGGEGLDRDQIDAGYAIAVDALGRSYVTGAFAFDAVFDPRLGRNVVSASASGFTDLYVMRLDADGMLDWVQSLGGRNTYTAGRALALIGAPQNPDVVVAGYFSDTITFPINGRTASLTPAPERAGRRPVATDLLIARYSNAGELTWIKQVGGPGFETVASIHQNRDGSLVMVGGFAGTADFDPGPARFNLTSIPLVREYRDRNERSGDRSSSYDAYVAYFSTNGAFISATSFGGNDDDFVIGMAPALPAELPRTVVLTGRFGSTATFPSAGETQNRTAAGRSDMFTTFFDIFGEFTED